MAHAGEPSDPTPPAAVQVGNDVCDGPREASLGRVCGAALRERAPARGGAHPVHEDVDEFGDQYLDRVAAHAVAIHAAHHAEQHLGGDPGIDPANVADG